MMDLVPLVVMMMAIASALGGNPYITVGLILITCALNYRKGYSDATDLWKGEFEDVILKAHVSRSAGRSRGGTLDSEGSVARPAE